MNKLFHLVAKWSHTFFKCFDISKNPSCLHSTLLYLLDFTCNVPIQGGCSSGGKAGLLIVRLVVQSSSATESIRGQDINPKYECVLRQKALKSVEESTCGNMWHLYKVLWVRESRSALCNNQPIRCWEFFWFFFTFFICIIFWTVLFFDIICILLN